MTTKKEIKEMLAEELYKYHHEKYPGSSNKPFESLSFSSKLHYECLAEMILVVFKRVKERVKKERN